jgi:hypothetical protein
VRERWVRSYLGYYLGHVKDDRCSIPENNPLPRHLTMLEEDLSDIGDVSFERLSTILRQSVKGGFKDVFLIEVRSIIAGVSTLHA